MTNVDGNSRRTLRSEFGDRDIYIDCSLSYGTWDIPGNESNDRNKLRMQLPNLFRICDTIFVRYWYLIGANNYFSPQLHV